MRKIKEKNNKIFKLNILIFLIPAILFLMYFLKEFLFLINYKGKESYLIINEKIPFEIIIICIIIIIIIFMLPIIHFLQLINYRICFPIKYKKGPSIFLPFINKSQYFKISIILFIILFSLLLCIANMLILSSKYKFEYTKKTHLLLIMLVSIIFAFILIIYKLQKTLSYIKLARQRIFKQLNIFKIHSVINKIEFLEAMLNLFSKINSTIEIYGSVPNNIRSSLRKISSIYKFRWFIMYKFICIVDLDNITKNKILSYLSANDILTSIWFEISKEDASLMKCQGWNNIYINAYEYISYDDIKNFLAELLQRKVISHFEEINYNKFLEK